MFTGALSWRRLGVLVTALPPESALVRTMNPRAAWSAEAYLLAAAVDALNAGNWQRAGKRSNPRPKPIPRPGDNSQKNYRGSSMNIDQFEAVYARAMDNVRSREDAGEVVWDGR